MRNASNRPALTRFTDMEKRVFFAEIYAMSDGDHLVRCVVEMSKERKNRVKMSKEKCRKGKMSKGKNVERKNVEREKCRKGKIPKERITKRKYVETLTLM